VAHTHVRTLVHSVFSTKERVASIKLEWQQDLWAYIGGIARENGFHALAVGGTENHLHALLALRSDILVAKAMQWIKGGSSRWIHTTKGSINFAWQDGYGSFSISQWIRRTRLDDRARCRRLCRGPIHSVASRRMLPTAGVPSPVGLTRFSQAKAQSAGAGLRRSVVDPELCVTQNQAWRYIMVGERVSFASWRAGRNCGY